MTSPRPITTVLFTLILACSPTAPGGTETTRADTDATSTSSDDSATVTSSPGTTEAWTSEVMTSTSSPSTGDATTGDIIGETTDGTTGGPACGPGSPLMPCKDDLTCEDGAFCVNTREGNFCSVPCGECGDAWPCAQNDHDLQCLDDGACSQHCNSDDDCMNGTICDDRTEACVWPLPCAPTWPLCDDGFECTEEGCTTPDPVDCETPGEYLGPCINGECNGDGVCTEGQDGMFCAPSCNVCAAGIPDCNGDLVEYTCNEAELCIPKCDPANVGCDDGTPAFEPCDAYWQCDAGLTCVTLTKNPSEIGNVCMPECSQCEDPETIIAADNLGAMPPVCSTDPGLCFVPCKSDADCNIDATCFDGTCGWKV